jgi:AcrR family transcriptional regulator
VLRGDVGGAEAPNGQSVQAHPVGGVSERPAYGVDVRGGKPWHDLLEHEDGEPAGARRVRRVHGGTARQDVFPIEIRGQHVAVVTADADVTFSAVERQASKERLITAAFELFEERGFEGMTVDDIAQRAGVGRTTFFRAYRSKEDVIFPEHDVLLSRIEARLMTAAPETRALAVTEAARIVLMHYLAEGELARARYRLTSTVPALRAREVAGIQQYKRLFARFLRERTADDPDGPLRAELLAAAVVTAHNHVLRRWLRNETTSPEQDFDRAMEVALAHFSPHAQPETTVVVFQTSAGVDAVVSRLHRVLSTKSASAEA